jgi:predicted ATPase
LLVAYLIYIPIRYKWITVDYVFMAIAGTSELLLAALTPDESMNPDDRSSSASHPERPVSEVIETIAGHSDRLSQQIEIVAAIEELLDDGLVERIERSEESHLRLTVEGLERAWEIREQLVKTSITLVEGPKRRSLLLGEATTVLDRSLTALAAECTEDDELYRDETEVHEDGIIGREAEYDQFTTTLEDCRQEHRGAAVVVRGPEGIGKTSFLDQLLDDIDQSDTEVIATRCDGASSKPYQPLRTALADRLADTATDPFDETRLEVDDPDTYRSQQRALFHDVTTALLPDDGSFAVFAIDDLDLADAGTREYVDYLLDRLHELPLLLAVSCRPDQLSEVITLSSDDDQVTCISLRSFEQDETRQLIGRRLGRPDVPDELVSAVYDRTGGNPLFVESTIEALLETDQLDPQLEWYPETADEIDLPDKVQETFLQKIDAIDERAREILDWAAVAGESMPLVLLESVCDCAPDRLETVVSALVEAELLVRAGETVRFHSKSAREALLSEFDPAEREHRHGVVASILDTLVGGDQQPLSVDQQAAAIAYQHEHAGEAEQAVEWYLEAADRATSVYAHEAAINHAHSALDIGRDAGLTEPLLDAGELVADVYSTTGAFDQARQYVQFTRERLSDERTDRRARLYQLQAKMGRKQGRYRDAVEFARDGLAIDGLSDEQRCQLLFELSYAQFELGECEPAREAAMEQRTLAEQSDNQQLLRKALGRLGQTAFRQGDIDTAEHFFERALATQQSLDDREGAVTTHNNLGILNQRRGNYETARDHFEQARAEAEEVGDRQNLAMVIGNLVNVANATDQIEDAVQYSREALERLKTIDNRHGLALAKLNFGSTLLKWGEYDRAREEFDEALSILRAVGGEPQIGRVLGKYGQLERLVGRFDRAETRLESALEEFDESNVKYYASIRAERGILARNRGNEVLAATCLEEALELAREHRRLRTVSVCRAALGELARQQNDHDEAATRLEAALDAVREMDAAGSYRTAQIRLRLGRLERDREQYDAASDQLDRAAEAANAVDAAHIQARIRFARGTIATEQCHSETAVDHWTTARKGFEEVGALREAVETLERLVETNSQLDDPARGERWCDRTLELLAEADWLDDDGKWFAEQRRSFASATKNE